jgi:uncharacterized protein YbjT (DUF2867 family)
MKVTLTAPTGNIGRPLTDAVLKGGAEVTLLARNPEKVQAFVDRGARVEAGSLSDGDYVNRATAGAEVLFWLTPPDYTVEDFRSFYGQMGTIAAQAVRENAIPRVVHLSSIGAHLPSGTGPVTGLHDIEGLLDDTSAAVTHLRPAYFMENLFNSIQTIKDAGSVFLPVRGSVSLPIIATRDIAAAAAARILDPSWTGRHVMGLHGPRDLSFDEMAQILSEGLGKPVNHVTVPPEAVKEGMMAMGMTAGSVDTMLELYSAIDTGYVTAEMPRSEETTTPTEFAVFVREVLKPMLG